jgi:cysteine sulfinate desulfinase/cysteine desulfurase-like protein
MELYGNPSSTHKLGRAAKDAFENARAQVRCGVLECVNA